MTTQTVDSDKAKRGDNFERALALAQFTGLKTILENLSHDREKVRAAVDSASSYENLLARLGHSLTLTKQIHVQDAFTRLAPAGGIKSVLPYYDIPTQSSFPTLVNIDRSVTTTEGAMRFFNGLLMALQKQCGAASQKQDSETKG